MKIETEYCKTDSWISLETSEMYQPYWNLFVRFIVFEIFRMAHIKPPYRLCYKRDKGQLTNSKATSYRQHPWLPCLETIKLASIYITSRKIAMSWITTVWLIGVLLFRRCQHKVTSLRCRLWCRKPWRPEVTVLSLLLMVIPCSEWKKVRRKLWTLSWNNNSTWL